MSDIHVRCALPQDLEHCLQLQGMRWNDNNQANLKQLQSRLEAHPEAMFVAEENKRIVGMVFAMRINTYDYDNPPTWYTITNNGPCDNHVHDGKLLFGVDLTTAPGVGARAGDKLLIAIAHFAARNNIEICMLGGRLPGYHRFQDRMSAEEYLRAHDEDGQCLDRQVRFYTSIQVALPAMEVVKVLPNYFDDPESCDYGVLIRWMNPFYESPA